MSHLRPLWQAEGARVDISLLVLLLGCGENDDLDVISWAKYFKCCFEGAQVGVYLL